VVDTLQTPASDDANPSVPLRIPIVDISGFRTGDAGQRMAVARQVDEACREVGFLVVTGHGVANELVDETRRLCHAFFDLPTDTKLAYTMPADRYRGYTSSGMESLSATYGLETPPDLKESFSIGPVDVPDDDYARSAGAVFADNMWAREVPQMEAVWSEYYRAMEQLAADLMAIFALALGLPDDFFTDKIDRHITVLSAIHYPPLDAPALPNQLRGGAHTDFGSLTILQRDEAPGGLQVQLDGTWVDAPHVPHSFTVNLGQLMAEWTNDRWVSTIHRVVLPEVHGDVSSDRLSLPFFHQPNFDAVIEVIPSCITPHNPARYEPVTSGEHIARLLVAMRSPAQAMTSAGQDGGS
jgi:isopenicillin N synthase-like dioxygenase